MTKPYDPPEKDDSDQPRTGLDTIENPADDPQTRPALDLEVGLAERQIPEDT
jgi:hypothetical protein